MGFCFYTYFYVHARLETRLSSHRDISHVYVCFQGKGLHTIRLFITTPLVRKTRNRFGVRGTPQNLEYMRNQLIILICVSSLISKMDICVFHDFTIQLIFSLKLVFIMSLFLFHSLKHKYITYLIFDINV